ncbi:MAG: serine/threonine protein phosphatase [Myxococcales bacterium]|nr:serine/threonine protein phosphatase [Myxococcales bacterium]
MLKFSTDPDVAEQQMNAVIFYLTAFGYIDGDFDRSERLFVREYITKLVESRAHDAMPDAAPEVREEISSRFTTHFLEVFEQTNNYVQELFTEVVANKEEVDEFVYLKLKLRSYEIFKSFDEENQLALLDTIDELINADGKVHPAETKFRSEISALLESELPLDDHEVEFVSSDLEIHPPTTLDSEHDNHPIFEPLERHYSSDPDRMAIQAEADLQLIMRTMDTLNAARTSGAGKLAGKQNVAEFDGQAPFLDGNILVHPAQAGETYELIVLGDLHGCYSCLKGALLQSNFFAKVEAYRLDPKANPNPKLVLLGDYIDRGHFSYNGVLRTVMQLYCTAPEHVIPLRGNHEYYLEYRGRIYGGVKPADAINTLQGHMPNEMFESYMELFEALPNVCFFDRTMFVHAGIPRDADLREKWVDMNTLNDPDLRFQMLWSDPSHAKFIPEELQAQNARFPFGQNQFEAFMAKIGCSTLVRGHEKVVEGFCSVYKDGGARLLSLFSAGGENNRDLPEDSSYRDVTPMAMTMTISEDETKVTPWVIEYEKFNDPSRNLFFASAPEIAHKRS